MFLLASLRSPGHPRDDLDKVEWIDRFQDISLISGAQHAPPFGLSAKSRHRNRRHHVACVASLDLARSRDQIVPVAERRGEKGSQASHESAAIHYSTT